MLSVLLGLGSVISGFILCIFLTFGEKREHHKIKTDAKVVIGILFVICFTFTVSFFVSVFT